MTEPAVPANPQNQPPLAPVVDAIIANPGSNFLDQVVESDRDVVGLVALANLIISAAENPQKLKVIEEVIDLTPHEIDVYRSSSLKVIADYNDKSIKTHIDAIRMDILESTYQSVIKNNMDFIMSEQRNNFETVITELQTSGGVARQILIAVISAFIFGLVVTGARLIDNPFSSPVQTQQLKDDGKK